MVLISLFYFVCSFKAVSGVHQKHPLPGVFHFQFHLIMDVYFHLARIGKD